MANHLTDAIKRFDVPGILAARISDDITVETTGPNIDRLRKTLYSAVETLRLSGENSARIVFRRHRLGGDVAGVIRVYKMGLTFYALALKPNLEGLVDSPEVLVTLADGDVTAALRRWADAVEGRE